MSTESIVVRGARVHNLKNIDFEIPHNTLTVVTGVSGSGKSSLAFDTIYAEGQRRYVESLSAYARQFLERIEKPDVDVIDGIAPAVAIRQKNSTRNPRSTVATATEVYDYLRLLFARVGRTYCLQCGREVKKDTVDEVAKIILALGEDVRLNVLFPLQSTVVQPPPEQKAVASSAKGRSKSKKKAPAAVTVALSDQLKTRLFDLRKCGFNRLYQNNQIFEFSTPESLLDVDFAAPVYILVDRLAVSADVRARIVDAIELSYREAGEVIFVTAPQDDQPQQSLRFSHRFECKNCNLRYEEPEPRLFSFNNPYGACPRCQGFGNTIDFDPDLVIPDKSKTLNEGAIAPWTKPKYRPLFMDMKRFARQADIPLDVPWAELAPEYQHIITQGEGRFLGIRGFFNYLERKKYKLHVRVFLSRYRGYSTCSECNGSRLRVEARQVKINGKNICEACSMTVEEASKFFEQLQLTEQEAGIADKLLQEILERLRFLNEVGLEYLTLDRLSSTLSGGEAQRIQLATSLGSRLVGTLYVLDEPSIGLHSRDTHRLIKILHDLRDLGNTILVVEHDPDVMRASDLILDLGPGAGENGGKIIAAGTYKEILNAPASLTGRYLSGELHIQQPASRRKPGSRQIKLFGAKAHNLKNVDINIPLGMIVAITGVSGSGKSTLVHDVLYQALATAKRQTNGMPSASSSLTKLEGADYIDEVVLVDQSPIGRTPRSNPVTYIKAFDGIRDLFASLPESQKRGLTAGHFSFNVPGGRCETCQGDGTVTVEMQFLADVELICGECKGTRYKPLVLESRYRGKNIHETLNLTVKESLQFFTGVPKIVDKLRVLEEIGLGYLRLGQSATTLSGGEAQRMKLAAHLQPTRNLAQQSPDGERRRNHVLYIFDEPTTGLHFDDVSKLLSAFRRLIDAGGSVLVIEHNLEVIKTADWVIDLGPEGGERGGYVLGSGPPEAIIKLPNSYTGKFLSRVLNGNGASRSNGRNHKFLTTIALGIVLSGGLVAQSTHTTVRHHKVIEEDPSQPPELTQAENAIQKKDYATAEPLLKKVVTSDPTNYLAWFDLGFTYNALGNTAESIASYRKSVAAKPDVFESNLNLGLMLAKTGQPDAEIFLRAATKLKPTAQVSEGRARAWLSLGRILAPKDPDGAIEAFHQAALLQPKDPEPHLSLGPIYEGQNHFADAEQEYKQALALDPNSADAFTGLANIYMRGQRFGDAEDALRKLIALRPNDAGTHTQLGRMLAADKRYDEAIAELQSTLKIAPNALSVQSDLADIYIMAGKYVEAEAQFRALLPAQIKNPQLHAGLGQALLKQRKFPEAQQEFIGAVSLKPDFGEAWGSLAITASENKNYGLVLKALEERSKFLPDIAICYFMRASAYDHLRDPKLASENYHRFLETANGQYPDQEWQARHRLIAIEPKKR